MTAPPGAVPTPFSVKGKSAIITGAGSGINYEFAKLLLSRDCNVLIADLLLRPEAQKLVDEHSSRNGGPRAVFVKTNVTIWDELGRMFEEAEREFGDISIVCPGAGVFEPHWSNFWRPPGSAESRDLPHGEPSSGLGHYATLDLNLTHPIRTTQLAVSRWLNPSPSLGDGAKVSLTNPKRIVHISSVAGQVPSFAAPLYAASKAGLSSFIRSLKTLDTLGIRVNGVAPGTIRTPLWTDHPEKLMMMDEALDVWVEPQEVAEQMLRCCEDEAVGPGVVWEVLKGTSRSVGWMNDPGPSGPGSSVSNATLMAKETFEVLAKPMWGVIEMLKESAT